MNNNEAVDRIYRVRDAPDFQLRFAELTKTPIVTIDKEAAYLFKALIEAQIKKMNGDN